MKASRLQSNSISGTCITTKSLLLVVTLFAYLSSNGVLMSPVGGEGMVPEFMAGLNSVPRMGRRSMNPFMRSALGGGGSTSTNSGGFRFLNSRPRRRSGPYNPFGGGFPAFRFVGGPGLYQGALRSKREEEVVPDNVGNGLHSSKRVLPPVHVGSSMFPSVRQQQNQYWQNLLNAAARESLLQRLSGLKDIESDNSTTGTDNNSNVVNVDDYSHSPLARFLSKYQGSHDQ